MDFASALSPPHARMARSTALTASVFTPVSQPLVDSQVNREFLADFNRRLHAVGVNALGEIIKRRLLDLGRTQTWLAERVGVSENAVSKWIKTGQISIENAKQVAHALEISLDALLSDTAHRVAAPQPSPTESELDRTWNSFPPELKEQLIATVQVARAAALQPAPASGGLERFPRRGGAIQPRVGAPRGARITKKGTGTA
jgi:Predicted transcriptional regulators